MFFLMIPILGNQIFKVKAEGSGATFTGVFSIGVDSNGDGFFESLGIGVEVNVTEAGIYTIVIDRIMDNDSIREISVWASQYYTLDVGIQRVYFYFDGSMIFLSGLNPTYISSISLIDSNGYLLESLNGIPLSRKYLYTEFMTPGATLTGTIHDQGIDTDGNGIYDYLEIGVEVNVTEAGDYVVEASGLTTRNNENITVYSGFQIYSLAVGVHTVNLRFDGPTIYASGLNPRNVSYIALRDNVFGVFRILNEIPLSREYLYTKFGKIPSALSCSVSKDTVTQGESIVVSGSINLTLSGITVTLTYKKPNSSTMNRTVTTGSDGSYSDSYTSDATGSWSVSASWPGDTTHIGATSSSQSFMVNAIPFIETPLGMALIGGGIILIVIVAVVWVLRRRKT